MSRAATAASGTLAVGLAVLFLMTTGAPQALSAVTAKVSAQGGPCGQDVQPPDIGYSKLNGVTVLSRCNAWAVGWWQSGTTDLTLVEHWNGRAWKKVPTPTPAGSTQAELLGVSAISSHDIWAVGTYFRGGEYTLVEHWDGTDWSQVRSPSPGRNGTEANASLVSVAAVSPTDAWAVGSYADLLHHNSVKTLIERWDGARWSQVPSPNPGTPDQQGQAFNGLSGVTALPGPIGWAVGSYNSSLAVSRTLILRWTGKVWRQVPSPNGTLSSVNHLSGVSASAASNAWAVGGYWNGSGPTTLVARWNGRRWARVASPNPSPAPSPEALNAVLTTSPTNVWAAGYWSSPAVGEVTWILHWNGLKWMKISTPNPGGSLYNNELNAISGSSCASIWAVGDYYDNLLNRAIAAHC